MNNFKKVSLALALILGLSSCANDKASKDQSKEETAKTQASETIKIGVVGEKNEIWEEVIKRYEKATGKKAELVKFSDYIQPNEALVSGDIDPLTRASFG